jgi:lysophospholipase
MSFCEETKSIKESILMWQQAKRSYFSGVAEVDIAFIELFHSSEHPTIVVSPGRCESYEKYQELAIELYHKGYNIFIIDHRGQGLSSRLLSNPHKGYVVAFDDYAKDLITFISDKVKPRITQTPFLLAHSMGAAIALRTLQLSPNIVQSAALCSPMLQINSGNTPIGLAKLLIRVRCLFDKLLGRESGYFINQGDYKAKLFADNELTHSLDRYKSFLDLYQSTPNIQLGGVTNHWLSEAVKANHDIFDNLNCLRVPLMLLQAGKDSIVDNHVQNQFCREAARFCPISGPIVFANAKHELLFETDDIRSEAVNQIQGFFQSSNSN